MNQTNQLNPKKCKVCQEKPQTRSMTMCKDCYASTYLYIAATGEVLCSGCEKKSAEYGFFLCTACKQNPM